MYIIRFDDLIKKTILLIYITCLYRLSVSFIILKESHCGHFTINFTYGGKNIIKFMEI